MGARELADVLAEVLRLELVEVQVCVARAPTLLVVGSADLDVGANVDLLVALLWREVIEDVLFLRL